MLHLNNTVKMAEFRNGAGAAGSARAKFSGHPRKILGSERAALEKNLEKVQFFIIRAKFWELNAQLWSKICKRCKFFCNCASFWNTYLLKAFIYLHETWFTLFCRNLVLSWITRFLRKKIQLKSCPRKMFDISKLISNSHCVVKPCDDENQVFF